MEQNKALLTASPRTKFEFEAEIRIVYVFLGSNVGCRVARASLPSRDFEFKQD